MDWADILLARILGGEKYRRATHDEWKKGAAFLALLPLGALIAVALMPLANTVSIVALWLGGTTFGIALYFTLEILVRLLSMKGIALVAGVVWTLSGAAFWIWLSRRCRTSR